MKTPFIITIVGPESSGKTTLARELAEAIGCSWVPEHARLFLEQLGRPYQFEDLHDLAVEQWRLITDTVNALTPKDAMGEVLAIKELFNEEQGFSKKSLIAALIDIRDQCLIIDSGMLTIQQWATIKYGRSIPFVEALLGQDITSLYLVARARHDWEPDPLREAPVFIDRVWIYNQYMQAAFTTGIPFYSVNVDVTQASTD